MENIKVSEIIKAINGTCNNENNQMTINNVSIDTRKVIKGDLFIAIKGENFDAHDFIKDAFKQGCAVAIVNRPIEGVNKDNLIIVNDTLEALQDLAKYYLSLFDVKKVAITGSTGKTSTKELIVSVLEEKYKVAKNIGNFNNHIGLPLSIFNIDVEHEVAVFEMGMNNLMEIDLLASIVRPHIGVITNVGLSHIENLETRENILKAKMEIANYFSGDEEIIVNTDNDMLLKATGEYKNFKFTTVGKDNNNDYQIEDVQNKGIKGIKYTLKYNNKNYNIELPLVGNHNATNATLAIAVGIKLGMTMEQAIKGAEKHQGEKMRLSIEKGPNDMIIINDVYNASPDSMMAAIDALLNITGKRKIAILSDMLEMGAYAKQYHEEIGIYCIEKGIDAVLAVGENAKYIIQGCETRAKKQITKYFKTNKDLINKIDTLLQNGDVILVKGSRGMQMEQIVEHILRGAAN